MEKKQSAELAMLFSGVKNAGNLDYVTGWYKKAPEYIQGTQIECAFVSTNSICQGAASPYFVAQSFCARGAYQFCVPDL